MRIFPLIGSTLLCLVLTSCTGAPPPSLGGEEQSSSQISNPEDEEKPEPPKIWETKNVTYQGKVLPAGISIYMEGTHRLQRPSGQFILLESGDIDLNGYVGEEVEAFGTTRPTVEGGAIIMHVEVMKLLRKEEPKTETGMIQGTDPSVTRSGSALPKGPAVGSEEPSGSEREDPSGSRTTSSGPSGGTEDTEESEEAKKPTEPDEPTKTSPPLITAELQVQADAMAKDKFESDQWTQEYCSEHIGFCIPIHRNWWYKSFGTTTSTLWHVEIAYHPILNLGDGVITINLISGPLKEDLEVQMHTEGPVVFAKRPWGSNQHFEVTAPALLSEAVRYLLEHLAESGE